MQNAKVLETSASRNKEAVCEMMTINGHIDGPAPSRRKGKILNIFLGSAISLGLILFLGARFDWRIFTQQIKGVRLIPFMGATAVYIMTYVFRAIRFNALATEYPAGKVKLFSIVCLHNFFNHVMPFRSGEISFLYFQNRYLGTPTTRSGGYLLVARLLDLVALSFWLLILLPGMFSLRTSPTWTVLSGIILFVALYGVFEASKRRLERRRGRPGSPIAATAGTQRFFFQKVNLWFRDAARDILQILASAPVKVLLTSSVLIWFTIFLYFHLVLTAFGQGTTFIQSTLPALGATLGNLLPVNSLGSVGTFEAGLVIGSSVTGASLETSVPLSFIIHGHVIATGGAAAFFSWLYLTFQKTGA